jgi:membrane-associated phospholipid phosphatase
MPFWDGLAWAVVYGLLVSLAPIIVVLYLLRTGRIRELHMSDTSERHLPYLSAIFFSAVAFAVLSIGNGPSLLRCLTIFNMVELGLLAIINIFWLISIHATGIMASFVLVGLIFGWQTAVVVVLPFVVAVCAVRLYLKRHTPGQVAAGLSLGVVSALSLTLLACFVS